MALAPTIEAVAPITDTALAEALEAAVAQVRHNLPTFTHAAQNHSSVNNFYPPVDNTQWTAGFWPGQIWLAWEATGDDAFRKAAEIQVASFAHRIENKIAVDHHDMGFLYTPTCMAAWKLTGNEQARKAALLAADQLASRFHEKGQFLQAWGSMGADGFYQYIIDCLMNLPILFWASEETGDERYRDLAQRHLKTTLANSIRPDFSTYHTFFMDRETGAPLRGATNQGHDDDSSWARGQAWGIAGLAYVYAHAPDPADIEIFDKLLAYYLDRLPADLIPYWDLIFSDGDDEPRDSSAAAIVACGLLEMARHVPEARARELTELARKMLASLWEHYAVRDPKLSNGQLLHGTYSKKTPYNTCHGEGVDECVSWGDYFYFEALTRLSRNWQSYW
jgi:unsaturated chondroitin disaccharide hydrolase